MCGPKGTPRPILDMLTAALDHALDDENPAIERREAPRVRDHLSELERLPHRLFSASRLPAYEIRSCRFGARNSDN